MAKLQLGTPTSSSVCYMLTSNLKVEGKCKISRLLCLPKFAQRQSPRQVIKDRPGPPRCYNDNRGAGVLRMQPAMAAFIVL